MSHNRAPYSNGNFFEYDRSSQERLNNMMDDHHAKKLGFDTNRRTQSKPGFFNDSGIEAGSPPTCRRSNNTADTPTPGKFPSWSGL